MSIDRVRAQFQQLGMEERILEFAVSSATVELAAEAVGVPAAQIAVSGLCTACHPALYWSHRKMGNARGVQAAAIAWKGSLD